MSLNSVWLAYMLYVIFIHSYLWIRRIQEHPGSTRPVVPWCWNSNYFLLVTGISLCCDVSLTSGSNNARWSAWWRRVTWCSSRRIARTSSTTWWRIAGSGTLSSGPPSSTCASGCCPRPPNSSSWPPSTPPARGRRPWPPRPPSGRHRRRRTSPRPSPPTVRLYISQIWTCGSGSAFIFLHGSGIQGEKFKNTKKWKKIVILFTKKKLPVL